MEAAVVEAALREARGLQAAARRSRRALRALQDQMQRNQLLGEYVLAPGELIDGSEVSDSQRRSHDEKV